METFAKRVKSRRLELKMSQADLAKAADISQSTIAQIESGRNEGSKFLLRLADALAIDPRWLSEGGEASRKTSGNTPIIGNPKGHGDLLDLGELSPMLRKFIEATIKASRVGVSDNLLVALTAHFETLHAAQTPKSAPNRGIEPVESTTNSEQVQKGRAGVKAALPKAENSDQSGHERSTGTER